MILSSSTAAAGELAVRPQRAHSRAHAGHSSSVVDASGLNLSGLLVAGKAPRPPLPVGPAFAITCDSPARWSGSMAKKAKLESVRSREDRKRAEAAAAEKAADDAAARAAEQAAADEAAGKRRAEKAA